MKSFCNISAIIGLAALASTASAAVIEKRTDPSVYLCTGKEFTGYCVNIQAPSGTCVPLASDLDDKIESVGPNGNSFCYFFIDAGCNTNADFFHVGSPGVPDLVDTPIDGPPGSTHNFANQISSYSCSN